MSIATVPLFLFPPLRYWPMYQENQSLEAGTHIFFSKNSWFNRYRIVTSNGAVMRTVPIVGGRTQKTLLKDLRISYSERWQHDHWQTIRSAYGRAPYFEHFSHELQAIIFQRHEYLVEFSTAVLKWLLNISLPGATLQTVSESNEVLFLNDFEAEPYRQVFSDRLGLISDVSVLDKLLCSGPRSLSK